MRALLVAALLAAGCTAGSHSPDGGALPDAGPPETPDAGPDAGPLPDAGPPDPLCGCTEGLHNDHIFLMSADGGLHRFDPIGGTFALVVDPACATAENPYSMGVDPSGRAWIQYIESRRVQRIDVNDLSACEDSGYLPTNADFPHFGMSFVQRGDCAELFGFSYSGDGAFGEGPDEGALGRVEDGRMITVGAVDFDGGELAGTGDGRLFAFTGQDPAKILELDPDTGEELDRLALEAIGRTNSSAFAFFGGDIYLFTEAVPDGCDACFASECPDAWAACQEDDTCSRNVRCAIETASISDACGGGASAEMHACMSACSDPCFIGSRGRVSQIHVIDWDRSEGPERTVRRLEMNAPIRVVGAGTSPCVPVVLI